MQKSIRDLVPYDPGLTLEQLEKKVGKKIIKLSANESLWGPSPLVKTALQEAFNNLNYYPDGVAAELKKALASCWNLPEENFCLGNGTDELIFLLTNAFLNPGDEVVIPTPTFSSYASSVKIVGGKVKPIPQEKLSFKLTEIAEAIHTGVKMVFLCNPNNPTGTFFKHGELEVFLKKVAPETLVILDEAYCQYATDPQFPVARELVNKYPNLIVLRTFSKVYGLAALRVGYAVAHKDVITELEKVRQPYNVNIPAQIAALAAWQDEVYRQKVVKETVEERVWVTETLQQKGLKVLPSQSNFLLVQHHDAELIEERLLQEGFLIRHTASFGLPDWFRITIAPHQEMKLFMDSLERVLTEINS